MGRGLRPNLYRTIKVRAGVQLSFFPRSPRALTATTCRAVQQVVMTDGATFRVPSAVRMVSKTLALERDPANHPIYLVRALVLLSRVRIFSFLLTTMSMFLPCAPQGLSDQTGLMSRREEARLARLQRKSAVRTFDGEDE